MKALQAIKTASMALKALLPGTVNSNTATAQRIVSNGPEGERIPAKVIRTTDGDTIHVLINGVEEIVRLLLIDTPETHKPGVKIQPWGPEASAFTKSMLTNKEVILELTTQKTKRDKYGRLLAFVHIAEENFNMVLVRNGYARVAYTYRKAAHLKDFIDAQEAAEQERLNIWRILEYVQKDGFHPEVVPPMYGLSNNRI